jgi:hypothetical protein
MGLFAAQAAILVANVQSHDNARRLSESLRAALAGRDLIGQAKGMVMQRDGVDGDTAFAMLAASVAATAGQASRRRARAGGHRHQAPTVNDLPDDPPSAASARNAPVARRCRGTLCPPVPAGLRRHGTAPGRARRSDGRRRPQPGAAVGPRLRARRAHRAGRRGGLPRGPDAAARPGARRPGPRHERAARRARRARAGPLQPEPEPATSRGGPGRRAHPAAGGRPALPTRTSPCAGDGSRAGARRAQRHPVPRGPRASRAHAAGEHAPGSPGPAPRQPAPPPDPASAPPWVPVEGSMAGRAFRTGRTIPALHDGPPRYWVPVLDGDERLGVPRGRHALQDPAGRPPPAGAVRLGRGPAGAPGRQPRPPRRHRSPRCAAPGRGQQARS